MIIFTSMPAARHAATAASASSRGGSTIACEAEQLPLGRRARRSAVVAALERPPGEREHPHARAGHRVDRRVRAPARSRAAREHRLRARPSGTPPRRRAVRCSVTMNLRAPSNGSVSMRGHAPAAPPDRRRRRPPPRSSAVSVGSGVRRSAASLQSTPAAAAPACRRRDGSAQRPAAGVQTATTRISLRVSVPVLSVQMTVVLPSVSTAGSRRTTARRRGHPLHADGERDRDDRRQPLGDRGDGERHRRERRVERAVAARERDRDEQQRDDADRRPRASARTSPSRRVSGVSTPVVRPSSAGDAAELGRSRRSRRRRRCRRRS